MGVDFPHNGPKPRNPKASSGDFLFQKPIRFHHGAVLACVDFLPPEPLRYCWSAENEVTGNHEGRGGYL